MKKVLQAFLVIMAGEVIFMLPFLIPRLIRPLMLEGWSLTNQQIGLAFSAYGVTSLISYFIGGFLADKLSAQKLIAVSLMMTSFGGYLLTFFFTPGLFIFVYGYFGASTILLMWGAMIKLTHLVGGESSRASAMGVLDGGRGLVAALMGALLVYLLASLYTLETTQMKSLEIIYFHVSNFTLALGIVVFFGLKNIKTKEGSLNSSHWSLKRSLHLLKRKDIWALSIIVLTSYCGYKSIDNYSIYLVDVVGVSVEESSRLTSILFWLRPFSAVCAGFFADYFARRIKGFRFSFIGGLLLLSAFIHLLLAFNIFSYFTLVFLTVVVSATLVYAVRAVYFAVFGDLNIPNYLVGSAVGIVSVVGFLPDMFFGLVTGAFIDMNQGLLGYTYAFSFTAALLVLGGLVSLSMNFFKADSSHKLI